MNRDLHDIVWSTDKHMPERLSFLEPKISREYNNINGIVVVQDGSLVYEEYFNDCDANCRHHMASVTKSILSALIGIAIDQGYIESENNKLADYFTEYNTDYL